MVNMPQMAKRETLLFRYIRRFHEQLQSNLGSVTVETLRSAAWQIEEYLEDHGTFKDAEFIRTIQKTIEFIIQKKCGTKWSIERAKKDLRGRTRDINQYGSKTPKKRVHVPVSLSKSIEKQLIDIPRREYD